MKCRPYTGDIRVVSSWHNTVVVALVFMAAAGSHPSPRSLALTQSRYSATVGGRVEIQAAAESLAFMRSAKTRSALATGRVIRNFAIAPTPENDKILLGVPLTTQPGDYAVEISFATEVGQERIARIDLSVEPFALTASSSPPAVLLDGFQGPGCPTSTTSSGTFGTLQAYLNLPPNSNPNVLFFENCTECPNCSIEQLGGDLASVLTSVRVPQ